MSESIACNLSTISFCSWTGEEPLSAFLKHGCAEDTPTASSDSGCNDDEEDGQGASVSETKVEFGGRDERRRKVSMRRMHAIQELLQTERDYVTDLVYLVEVCFPILARQDWIPTEHKRAVMRNANAILVFHRRLLNALERSTLAGQRCEGHIAAIFLELSPHFSLYNHYCDTHAEASSICAENRVRPEWSAFLRDCSLASNSLHCSSTSTHSTTSSSANRLGRLHFEDYLIKPVQRICRYQLLLREIVRYTALDSPSAQLLQQSLDVMRTVVSGIDDRKHQSEIAEQTALFVQRLAGEGCLNKQHLIQLGSLVLAGAIEVTYTALGQSGARPRYLGCFIFPTYVFLVRPKKATCYIPKHWFPLRFAEVEDLPDIDDQRENGFVVRCKKHAFAFTASSQREKRLWIRKFKQVIDETRSQTDNFDMESLILSSLPGVTIVQQKAKVRLSQSVTNMLDLASPWPSNADDNASPRIDSVRRSVSMMLDLKASSEDVRQPATAPKAKAIQIFKRYSADYSSPRRVEQSKKLRAQSAVYVADNDRIMRRRPSSMDLLALSNQPSHMIGKIKSNHQQTLRAATDYKLRDVCTRDYLSSRDWQNHIDNGKRRSHMLPSPSFSVAPTRRISDSGYHQQRQTVDFDMQSSVSSTTYTSDDRAAMHLCRRPSHRTSSTIATVDSSCGCGCVTVAQGQASLATDDGRECADTLSDVTTTAEIDYSAKPERRLPSRIERSFSTYSISLQTGIKSAFVDRLRRLTPRNRRTDDETIDDRPSYLSPPIKIEPMYAKGQSQGSRMGAYKDEKSMAFSFASTPVQRKVGWPQKLAMKMKRHA